MFSSKRKTLHPYTCQCCFKEFKRKYWYDRHCLWCERQDKLIDRERLDAITEIPTQHHMFEMIIDIKKKLDLIEKRVESRISTQDVAKRKTLLEVSKQDMSSVKGGCEFTSFFKELVLEFNDAIKILSHNLDVDGRGVCRGVGYGITEFIIDYVKIYSNNSGGASGAASGSASDNKYPLIYRSEILYVFSDDTWKILSYKAFNTIINLLTSKVLNLLQEVFSGGGGSGGGGDSGYLGAGGGGANNNSFDIDICFQTISIEEYMEYTQKLMYDISGTKFSEKYIKFLHNKLIQKMNTNTVSETDISVSLSMDI